MARFDGSKPGPGRPKGSQNKFGRLARENIVTVFEQMGGTEAMAEWARENRTEFYSRIYARMLPSEAHVTTESESRPVQEMSDAELMAFLRNSSNPDAPDDAATTPDL